MKYKFIHIAIISVLVTACTVKKWQISSCSITQIRIDSTLDRIADKNYVNYLNPIKSQIDRQMNIVIGKSAETLRSFRPESPLSNFNADVYRQEASSYMKNPVDIAIVNMGGLRTPIVKGDITIREIFELMPFDNELVILYLRGEVLSRLLQQIALVGGEGIAGIKIEISNNKIVKAFVNNSLIDKHMIYTIATSDYLAGGNDKLTEIANYEKRIDTGLKIRDILISHILSATTQNKMIDARIDGRIVIRNN